MKLLELTVKNFADAAIDAAPRGLTVGKQAGKTAVWVTDRYDFFKELSTNGFSTNTVDDIIQIKNIGDYKKAVAILEPLTNKEKFKNYILTRRYEKAYDKLQYELHSSINRFPVGTLQLFIPRPTIHNKKDKSWIYQDPDDQVDEGAPILPAKANAQGHYNKPTAALWTSTLKKSQIKKDGHTYYTSDWNEWVINNQSTWTSDWGYVYYVKPNARILTMNSFHDAERIYKLYAALSNQAVKFDRDSYFGPAEQMKINYPWSEIAKHWDGIHGGHHYSDPFFYGWDCESTAWFDPSILTYKGKVRIAQSSYTDD